PAFAGESGRGRRRRFARSQRAEAVLAPAAQLASADRAGVRRAAAGRRPPGGGGEGRGFQRARGRVAHRRSARQRSVRSAAAKPAVLIRSDADGGPVRRGPDAAWNARRIGQHEVTLGPAPELARGAHATGEAPFESFIRAADRDLDPARRAVDHDRARVADRSRRAEAAVPAGAAPAPEPGAGAQPARRAKAGGHRHPVDRVADLRRLQARFGRAVAQLARRVRAPAPERPIAPDGAGVLAGRSAVGAGATLPARRNRDPVALAADADGRRAIVARAVAQLAERVVTPAPERAALVDQAGVRGARDELRPHRWLRRRQARIHRYRRAGKAHVGPAGPAGPAARAALPARARRPGVEFR